MERDPNRNLASLLLDPWQQKGLLNPDLLPSLLADSLEQKLPLQQKRGYRKPSVIPRPACSLTLLDSQPHHQACPGPLAT